MCSVKKLNVLFVLFFLVLILGVSCKKSENYYRMKESESETLKIIEEKTISDYEQSFSTFNEVINDNYTTEEIFVEDIKTPGGIDCVADRLIVTDKGNDRLIIANERGKILKEIGKTGCGESEFQSPTAVKVCNGSIYVLDTGNKRIQVFSSDLEYERSILIEKDGFDYAPISIATSDECVYVSGLSTTDSVIDKYLLSGEHISIGNNFLGSVYSAGGIIYAINSMSLYYDKKEDLIGAFSMGPSFLMKIDNDSLLNELNLSSGFNIISFIKNDDGLFCLSGSGASIYKFSESGEYVETIAHVEGAENEENAQMSTNDKGILYVAMPVLGKIIKCYEKG